MAAATRCASASISDERAEKRSSPAKSLRVPSSEFRFVGSVPEAYHQHLFEAIFERMAPVLLDALALAQAERVLDVACGPGSVTRLAARRVGATGRVAGCDISDDMLAIGRRIGGDVGAAPIEYVRAPAAALPFGDAEFDAVSCQQGLQFFPDRVAALSEMRRVLTPDGRVGILSFRPPDGAAYFNLLRDAAIDAGAIVADAFPRGPFEYGSVADLNRDLKAAGFGHIALEERSIQVVFASVDHALAAVHGTPFGPPIVAKGVAAAFEREARRRLAPFVSDASVCILQDSHLVIARP